MKKIAKLDTGHNAIALREKVKAAITPFGSLSDAVPGLMMDVLASDGPEAFGAAVGALASELLRANDCDQYSHIGELSGHVVEVVTPTSGTKIRVTGTPRSGRLTVDFGERGSTSRALDILMAANRAGVSFTATDVAGDAVSRDDVLTALYERAETRVEWLQNLSDGYYPEEVREKFLKEANAEVLRIEAQF